MEGQALLLLGYLFTLVAIVGGFLFMRYRVTKKEEVNVAEAGAPLADNQPAGGRRGRRGLDRMRAAAAAVDVPEGEEEDGPLLEGKLTKEQKKKMEKERKRLEREARRQHEEDERKAKQDKDSSKAEKQKKKQEEREAKQKEIEEAERLAEEQKKKEEEEMFAEWKDAINVEDSGSVASLTAEESQKLLQEFIDYIKRKKVVVIEDLASEFEMKTKDAVNRIRALEESGRISGVIDDRGKFIYITEEELNAVAKFINEKGRVTISDVVTHSNRLIDLGSA